MFRFFLFVFSFLAALSLPAQTARNPLDVMTKIRATPEPLPPGTSLMREVRGNLPPMPLRLTGSIHTRSDEGETTRRLISELRFGDAIPHLCFNLADAFGDTLGEFRVAWVADQPVWTRNGESVDSPQDLEGTGLTGSDLALAFLWWPGAEVTGIERVRARDAFVVEIPVPNARGQVRLWIDKRALFVVKAETLDENENVLRRLEVDRLKKIREDLWMVQDLVVRDRENKRSIKIRFDEVEELN